MNLDPRIIEDEIARIRDRESNPFIAGTRTALFTLVVMHGGSGAGGEKLPAARGVIRTRVDEALDYILGKRPARIISIEPGEKADTTASVGGRCSPDALNRGVCFEEIRISSGRDGLGRRAGAWAPLVIRDLPVYALWLGPLSPYPQELREAAELLDKVIVDASHTSSPAGGLAELARERKASRTLAFADLAWRRTVSLRAQTARMFDAAESRERLPRVSKVSLSGGSAADAAELFLWLAARLGWRPDRLDAEGGRFSSASGGRVDAVHEANGPAGGFRISFSFSDGGGELAMTCRDNGCVSMGEETGVYRLLSDGEALLAELDSLEQDSLFAGVMDAALRVPDR